MHQLLNQKNHKFLIKITNLIVYLLILIGCCIITYTLIISETNECTSEPLVYGAKQMEKNFNYSFYGIGYFILPINTEMTTVTFNSTHLSWD